MCIALWALDHLDYSLILCSNRDEFLNRPTRHAEFHNFEKENEIPDIQGKVLSGRDAKAGGTWFGITRTGKIALLTNITEPVKQYKISRGYLTSSFLSSDSVEPLEEQVRSLVPQGTQFAGFNLLLLSPVTSRPEEPLLFDSLLVTNHGSGGAVTSRSLSASEQHGGCISNAVDELNSDWPKVRHAAKEFGLVLKSLSPESSEAEIAEQLFRVLSWRSSEPVTNRSELRNTVQVLPIPIQLGHEEPTSYGTRLSTVLLIKKNGDAVFIERDIWQLVDGKAIQAEPDSQRIFRFQVVPKKDV